MRSTYFAIFSLLTLFALAGPVRGTLVIAVPVTDGLVACADKRLYNSETGAFTDTNLKIRRAGDSALFAATNTIGFFDPGTGTTAFDAFDITEKYLAERKFTPSEAFWDGLKKELSGKLREYLATRRYAEWPSSDSRNNHLLFNLVFYSVRSDRPFSYTLRVFYEKAQPPVIYVSGPVTEEIKAPKLAGKGREVVNYLSRNRLAGADPLIQRFDGARFSRQHTTAAEAVDFAEKLFRLASTGVPQAHVSPAFDCALLGSDKSLSWLHQKRTPSRWP